MPTRKHRLIAGVVVIAVVAPIVVNTFLDLRQVKAWWNDDWVYRTKITFGNSGSAVTNQKVKFDIDTATLISAGKMQSDCGDSRFVDENGQVLRYFLDSSGGACNTSSTDYYVLFPNIVSGTNVIYHYYGNPYVINGTEPSQFSETTFSPTSGPSSGSEEKTEGPVAYWKFDEGNGSTAHDSSTNKNNASLLNPNVSFEQYVNILDQNQTASSSAETYSPTDNSYGLVHWDGTKYSGDTTYFETVLSSPDSIMASSPTYGNQQAVYCPSADNCKIVYTASAGNRFETLFADCNDSNCSSPIITIIDGGGHVDSDHPNGVCSLDSCDPYRNNLAYFSIDCINGADDCKITASDGQKLFFFDCDNESCTSGSITFVDGNGRGCALQSCPTTGMTYSDLDCSAGSSDCKIVYNRNSDLYFADCDNASCSSGTVTLVDGSAGCPLDNCTTGTIQYVSIDCVGGGDDCKIAYHDNTNGDLFFADCDNTTCSASSTQTRTQVAGVTNHDGDYLDMDCYNGADKCKIAYKDATNNDLYLADCNNSATCTSANITLLDGNTGCTLTGCSTTASTGNNIGIDCSAGEGYCRISYLTSSDGDTFVASCNNSTTCSSGNVKLIDGGAGCTLNNCRTSATAPDSVKSPIFCTSQTDCKVLWGDLGTYLFFGDCDDAMCGSGWITRLGGYIGTNNFGAYSKIDCPSPDNCKVAFYDTKNSSLLFKDCDDVNCSTGTITVLDGDNGCSLDNCSTTTEAGVGYLDIDCSAGSNNCKITYYQGVQNDLLFADCDSETCNTGTITRLDGGATNSLTGAANSTAGQYTSLDCSGGGDDCKIAYYRNQDLYFADCDNELCSSGTTTLVDGNTGCTATNCSTSTDRGTYPSLDCSNGTNDCKISYRDEGNGDLIFADCATAVECSTVGTPGTVSLLNGNTGCTLTLGDNCSTSDNIQYTSLDCSGGTDDCKVAYYDGSSGDLYFGDCENASCSSGYNYRVDGNTDGLTGYTDGAIGSYPSLDCSNGASDCKISYQLGGTYSNLVFADCDDAHCSTGTINHPAGSYNNTTDYFGKYTDIDCSSGPTDCKIVHQQTGVSGLNSLAFTNCNDAVCRDVNTVLAADASHLYVWAELYSESGTKVADGVVMTDSDEYTRIRTFNPVTLSDNTNYTVRIRSFEATYEYASLNAARLVVVQSDPTQINNTESQIEVGQYQADFSNTSYATLTDSPIYYFDSSNFTGTLTVSFEASIHTDNASNTVYAQLYQCTSASDCATGSSVGSSEVSHTGDTNWSLVRSNPITLTTGNNYAVQVKMSAGTGDIVNAKIIIDQDSGGSGLNKVELIHPIVSTSRNNTASSYSDINSDYYFDPDYQSSGNFDKYFEATLKTDTGTGYARLNNDSDNSIITNSEVSTANTTYTRVRSSEITSNLPTQARNLDTQMKSSSTNTTSIASTKLISDVTLSKGVNARWTGESGCVQGQCLSFDGISQALSAPNSNSINFNKELSDGFTIEAWVKPTSNGEGDGGRIFSKGTNTYLRTNNEGSDGFVDLQASLDLANSDATLNVTNAITLNQWHHIAITYTDDGDDEITLYVDGQYKASSTNGSGSLASDSNDLLIGGTSATNFNGYIDEFKIYPQERSANQIKMDSLLFSSAKGTSAVFGTKDQSPYNSSLVAYWNMDETAPNTCSGIYDSCDSSENALNADWYGNATSAYGKFGNSINLDGTDDRAIPEKTTAWYNSNWTKREPIYFTNTTSSALSEYQVQINVAYDQLMQADFDDLRFTSSTDSATLLNHWVEKKTDSSDATIWINVDTIPANSTSTIFMYWGNPSAPSTSSGPATFPSFFDDFSGSSVDTNNWTITDATGWSVSGGELAGTNTNGILTSNSSFGSGIILQTKYRYITNPSNGFMAAGFSTSSGNGIGFLNNPGNDSYWNTSAFVAGTITGMDPASTDLDLKIKRIDNNTADIVMNDYVDGRYYALNQSITNVATSLPIKIGKKYDNLNGNQTYEAYWDWMLVRKYAATPPSYRFGDEQSLINTPTVPMTISAWVNADTLDSNQRNVIARGSSPNFDWFMANSATDSGKIVFSANGTDIATSNTTLSTGNWYHLTLVANSSTQSLYINGQKDIESVYSGTTTKTGSISIGAAANGSQAWDGKIDEVRIYNRALSSNEVKVVYEWVPGPVGWWKMDENTGTVAYDSSGHGVTGSFTGNPLWVPAKFGSGLKFDGSTTALTATISDPGYYNTLEAWVYPTTSAVSKTIITASKLTTNGSSQPTYGSCVGTTLPLNQWTHIVATSTDSTHCSIYQNGVLTSSSATTGVTFGTNVNLSSTSNGLIGTLDDVKIYNYVRTASQIVEDMNAGHPAPGSPIGSAIAHWNFDEGYGNTAHDSSIRGNDLTLVNTPFTNEGKFGKAINLSEGNAYRSVSDAGDFILSNEDDATISTWFKSASSGNPTNAEYLVVKANVVAGTTNGYAIYLNSNGKAVFGIEGNGSWGGGSPDNPSPDDTAISSNDIYDSSWHFLTAVKTGASRIDLYIDGVLNSSDTDLSSGGDLSEGNNLVIGAVTDGTHNFNGSIDELQFFRTALTGDQIKLLYNGGFASSMGVLSTASSSATMTSSARSYCPPGDTDTCNPPVAEWMFDEGRGQYVYDTSGNGNTGTFGYSSSSEIYDPIWKTGKVGNAPYSDGVDDGLDVYKGGSAMTIDNIFDGGGTVSFWVYPTSSTAENDRIMDKAAGWDIRLTNISGNAARIYFYKTFSISAGGWSTVSNELAFNLWSYVTITYNDDSKDNNPTLYINSKPVSISETNIPDGTRNSDATNDLYILNYSGGTIRSLPGSIDNLRFYDYIRTPAQIAWDYNRGAPLAWYKFDECSGDTAYNSALDGNDNPAGMNGTINPGDNTGNNDSVGSCKDGLSDPANSIRNAGTSGKYSASLSFDGTNDYVDTNSDIFYNDSFSVCAWVKATSLDSNVRTIVTKRNSSGITAGDFEWSFAVQNAIPELQSSNSSGGGALYVTGNNTISTGIWYYLCGVQNGNGNLGKLYLNGTEFGSAIQTSVMRDTSNPVQIGVRTNNNSGRFWNGQIDDVKIWNYALTPEQVKMEYNAGSAVSFR